MINDNKINAHPYITAYFNEFEKTIIYSKTLSYSC